MIKSPQYVSGIKPYVPGKPVDELERELGIKGSIKLASNENPIGPSKKAVNALGAGIASLNRYPDGGGFYLRSVLANKLGVSLDSLILGNGSNELLDIAVRTFMQAGDEAVMAVPSFVVYAMSVTAQGGKAVEVTCVDLRHDLPRMAKAITEKTKIIFIANPNNPTGTMNTKEEFDAFMKDLPDGILVVVDEAYFEYVQNPEYADSMKHLIAGKDILILRTFSKIYGLAGLRIGYGITTPQIATEMNKIRPPFNTGTLSQLAAIAALGDDEHVKESIRVNEEGKKYLYAELSAMGMKHIPTETNFIYIPLDIDAMELNNALLKEGVIIRLMGPKAIRVTIGLPKENRRFIDALKKSLGRQI